MWQQDVAQRNSARLERLLAVWEAQDQRSWAEAGASRDRILANARAYIAQEPIAISGQRGHNRTFHVACVLVKGFALTKAEALSTIQDWNSRCEPPWSEAELRHKIDDATEVPGESGYLLRNGRNGHVRNGHAPNGAAGSAGAAPGPAVALLVAMEAVITKPLIWLWAPWIPLGTLTVLDGDPGLGKSLLTVDLAARLSRGWAMPPGGGDTGMEAAGVLILNAEDDVERTIRPRLEVAGADLSRVHFLGAVQDGKEERPPVIPWDLELIAHRVAELSIRLVIIDPLMAYIGKEYDSHKDQDIRRCLHRLMIWAQKYQITLLLVRHLNKLSGGAALYRGGGSIGITGGARSSLLVGCDPDDEHRRVLAMNKTNLGPYPTSLAYRIERAGQVARIAWLGETDLKPGDILGHPGAQRPAGRPSTEELRAEQFLCSALNNGARLARELFTAAAAENISEGTLRRAKKRLEIVVKKEAFGWTWALPASQGAHEIL